MKKDGSKPSFHLIERRVMKKRNINIDVLKCIAIIFVISVHFFLHFTLSQITLYRSYLLTVIRDYYWYPKFIEKWGDFSNILPKFPLVVFLLLLQSLVITFLLTSAFKYIQIIFNNPKIKGHYME